MDRPHTRAELRASGLSDDQIDRRLGSGRLRAVHRGVLSEHDPDVVALVRAARLAHPGRVLVASHLTVVRLLGLPRPLDGWPPAQFTCTERPVLNRPEIRVTVAPLGDGEVRTTDRVGPFTGLGRTLADCLRTVPARDALAIVDAALHRDPATREAVAAALARQVRWPGTRQARELLALADGRRETPLESWSAWAMHQVGLAQPVWQVDVFDGAGRFIGRCDGWWAGVAGEADGKSKYRLAAAQRGGAGPDELFGVLDDERGRESRMHDAGVEVVRWGAVDVLSQARAVQLRDRIEAARDRATRSGHFAGYARLATSRPGRDHVSRNRGG